MTFRPASVVPAVPWWTAILVSLWFHLLSGGNGVVTQLHSIGGGDSKGFNVSLNELLINTPFQNQLPLQVDEASSTQLGSSCSEIFPLYPLTFSELQMHLLFFFRVISCFVSSGMIPLLLF